MFTTVMLLDAGSPALEVWDLCRPQSVQAAQCFLREEQQGPDGRSMAGDVALALQEAVNCSSAARQTPLHAAAEAGNAVMVKVRAESILQEGPFWSSVSAIIKSFT